jgi:hypothetical protein
MSKAAATHKPLRSRQWKISFMDRSSKKKKADAPQEASAYSTDLKIRT